MTNQGESQPFSSGAFIWMGGGGGGRYQTASLGLEFQGADCWVELECAQECLSGPQTGQGEDVSL